MRPADRCMTQKNVVFLLTNFSNAWEVSKRSKATTQDRRRRCKRHRVKRSHQHRVRAHMSESLSEPTVRRVLACEPRSAVAAAFGSA